MISLDVKFEGLNETINLSFNFLLFFKIENFQYNN